MLPRLVEYERRQAAEDLPEDAAPQAYQQVNIRWYIDLDADGNLRGFVQAGDPRRGQRLPAPYRQPSSNILPSLLVGNGEYVLGLPKEERRKARATEAHSQFVELARQCAQATGDGVVAASVRFLERLRTSQLALPEDMAVGDNMTFRVGDVRIIDLPSVRLFWANYLAGAKGAESTKGQCLVCGKQNALIARLHDIKIKGIPGGQVAGTALVSFNADAFESYGLTQSFNAPVCQECAELYAKGLNRLIQGEGTSLRVEQVVYVFWTRERERFSVAKLLSNPEPQDVQALLESPWKAREAAPIQANAFYASAFSASGGRAVVRDWIESTLPEAQENLRRYFLRQRIPPLFGETPRLFPIWELVRSLTPQQTRRRPGESSEPPDAPTTLVHAALTGAPLPDWMLFLAVRRNHAEEGPFTRNRDGRILGWARAALIKLVLQSREPNIEPDEEGYMDTETQQSPAYLCGRLLALLEQAQSAAIPGAKATLIDRFYGSASSAPASVFGLLLKNAQNHLAKLERDNRGAYTNIQRGLEEVMSQLGQQLPRVLTLRDQAVFALGYYYQRAARWARQAQPDTDKPQS